MIFEMHGGSTVAALNYKVVGGKVAPASLAENTVDYLALEPLYLRAPNAALNKKLTEGMANGK